MNISTISDSNHKDLDLRQLSVFKTLLDQRNLTRAAEVLGVTQPALSKTLAQLRRHFDDPLFVRVGHRMEPSSKALEIEAVVDEILDRVTMLRAGHTPFDPAVSDRAFTFCVVDAGIVRLLPPLLERLAQSAPGIRLNVVPPDLDRLESSLESGRLDFAMGSFPSLSKRIRRQTLWRVNYLSAVRDAHPRIKRPPSLAAFAAEKHILVSASGTGHAHTRAEKAVQAVVPASRIACRVPTFLTAAFVASRSDAIVTLPAALGERVAEQLGLRLFKPPIQLPVIEVAQHWHERFHREPGSRWIRETFVDLFKEADGRAQLKSMAKLRNNSSGTISRAR